MVYEKKSLWSSIPSVTILLSLFWSSAGQTAGELRSVTPKIPLGLNPAAFYVPADNPLTVEKIALGRLLFFDRRLSKDGTIACANCHIPALGFTDAQPVAVGIHRQKGDRNAPMTINRAFSKAQFWDGRAATLEDQSTRPFVNQKEHGFSNHDEMLANMNYIEGYKKEFKKVFGTEITMAGIGKAIASFERTLLSGNSPFDRYDSGEEKAAISEAAKRGLKLFRNKAQCTKCHRSISNFTDEKFHNLGIGSDKDTVDVGRYNVTKNPVDMGAFKTPSLREISRTAPYMHDGRFQTLEDVVDFYNRGGIKNQHIDKLMIPLELTPQEKSDLVEFLRTLNGEGWQHVTAPAPAEFPR